MSMQRRDFLKLAAGGTAAAGFTASPVQALQREIKEFPPEAVGMLYDATLCIGCKACMVACKDSNGMPPEQSGQEEVLWDTPLDLSGDTLNVIKVYHDGNMEKKDREVDGFGFMKRHCLHCVDPSCVSVCPVSAMTKDAVTGIVEHHADRCIGCRYCVYGCPFNVPRYEYDEPFGQIQKCQFCAHLQAKGQIPACCDVCPTGASLFGTVDEIKQEAQRRLSATPGEVYSFPRGKLGGDYPSYEGKISEYQDELYGDTELGGTQVMYLAGIPFDKLGLPTDVPDYGYPAVSEAIQHTLYKGLIAPLVLFAGFSYLVHRSVNKSEHNKDEKNSDSGDDQ